MNVALAAVNDILDLVHDRRVGIIRALEVLPTEAGAPDFVHVAARVADPSVYGGEPGSFRVAAAGVDRAAATARASALALARYCAALYEREGLPLAAPAEATFRIVEPNDFALYSRAQYAEPGFPFVPFETETPVRSNRATSPARRSPPPSMRTCGGAVRLCQKIASPSRAITWHSPA